MILLASISFAQADNPAHLITVNRHYSKQTHADVADSDHSFLSVGLPCVRRGIQRVPFEFNRRRQGNAVLGEIDCIFCWVESDIRTIMVATNNIFRNYFL